MARWDCLEAPGEADVGHRSGTRSSILLGHRHGPRAPGATAEVVVTGVIHVTQPESIFRNPAGPRQTRRLAVCCLSRRLTDIHARLSTGGADETIKSDIAIWELSFFWRRPTLSRSPIRLGLCHIIFFFETIPIFNETKIATRSRFTGGGAESSPVTLYFHPHSQNHSFTHNSRLFPRRVRMENRAQGGNITAYQSRYGLALEIIEPVADWGCALPGTLTK